MKRVFLLTILGAIACLASIPVYADSYIAFRGTTPEAHTISTADGALTLAGWSDSAASVPSTLYNWWWLLGVNSGVGNGALIDGNESMTLQLSSGWGATQIQFIYTGSGSTPAPISISGFSSDPGAFATIYASPRISNLNYSGGTLTFDYAPFDAGQDFGLLNFANPVASEASTLKITYGLASGGAAVSQVNYVVVPEPASLSLLGLGAILAFGLRRRH